jgi:germination protein M
VNRIAVTLAGLLLAGAIVAGCGTEESEPIDAGAAPASSDKPTTTTTAVDGGAPAEGIETTIYLLRGERLTSVHRVVAETEDLEQAAAQAVEALVAGPTAAERAAGLGTAIPTGTRFLGLDIGRDRIATVDLSSEFESGGGTLSMTARLAQVACTLDNVVPLDIADGTRFRLDGKPVDVFSGEGIVLDEPVTCADYADLHR